jgi:hypothetical protein
MPTFIPSFRIPLVPELIYTKSTLFAGAVGTKQQ